MKPLVSVIMSVYNGEKYLKYSIESILNQTYKNIELIIVNDGSEDSSLAMLAEYALKDQRISIINNRENKGLIYSLNTAIDKSKGRYIARMDADDISKLNRIEEQVEFMEKNTCIALSGTGIRMFLDGKSFCCKSIKVESTYEKIKARSLFESCFMHPTVIFRADVIKENKFYYKEKYKHAEDFGLWTDIIANFKVVNINKSLLEYRVVKNSVTRIANRDVRQRETVFKEIYKNYINNLGYDPDEYDLDIHFEIAMIQNISKLNYSLEDKAKYLHKISTNINIDEIKNTCLNQYLKCCVYQGCYSDFKKSSFSNQIKVTRIEFVIKKIIAMFKLKIKDRYK